MPNEELIPTVLSKDIVGPISANHLARYLSPRSDLTYRKIENLEVGEIDINQSLLTGSLIRGCNFQKTNFSRSDLDGIRAENSIFVECDFTSCDFRSSIFAHCEFQSCNFNSTFIDDCEFQISKFIDCSFTIGSLTHCRFQKCALRSCDLKQATFLHNKIYDSSISHMVLGDCALQYVILRDCKLTRVTLGAESVGAMFGLTREQLADAKLIYLGENEPIPADSEIIFLLLEEYRKRIWHLGQLVLSVNFGLISTLSAFDNYLDVAYQRFAEFGFANGDELEFLGDLVDELASLNQLPLLTVLNVLEWCSKLESAINKTTLGIPASSGNALQILASRLTLLTNILLDRFEQARPVFENTESERLLCIKATFQTKPTVPLPDILNSLTITLNFDDKHRSKRIRIEISSYIDIIETTLLSVAAFQAFLFLINGCIIQITELKHRTKVLASKKGSKTYKDMALSPVQQPSPILLTMLKGLTEYAKEVGWLKDPSLSGYSSSNIKLLEETKCDD